MGLDSGEKGKKNMKTKIKYTDEDLGDFEIVRDFLPQPKDLKLKEENVRVTINLSKKSVEYYKKVAKTSHTKYQKIIRTVVDVYAQKAIS